MADAAISGTGGTRQLARDAATFAAAHYVATALGFARTALAARWLGPVGYGAAALMVAYPDLMWSAAGIKSADVTTRYLARSLALSEKGAAAGVARLGFLIDLACAFAAALVVWATGGWVGRQFLHLDGASLIMPVYALSFVPASLGGTGQAVLTSAGRFGTLAALQVASAVVQLLLAAAALSLDYGAPGLVFAAASAQAIGGVLIAVSARRAHSREGVGSWFRASLKDVPGMPGELGRLFGWNYLFLTLRTAFDHLPALVLGAVRSPAEAGYYRLATSIATVCSYPENALSRVVYPQISTTVAGPRELRKRLLSWSLRLGAPFTAAILAGLLLLDELVLQIFGPGFLPVTSGLAVLLAGVALTTLVFWAGPLYYATGRVAAWTRTYAIFAAAVLILSWPCAVNAGFTGLAALVATGKALFAFAVIWLSGNWTTGGSRLSGGSVTGRSNLGLPAS